MFWKFHLDSSGLDTLLAKQDVTLKEVLDEEDILQECKSQNTKLLEFLTNEDILKELLHLVVDKQSNDDVGSALEYKYMNLACEVLISDINIILDKVANNQEYLDILWSFTDTPTPLNPLVASFFSKVISILICQKGQETFNYLKSHDAVNKLIVHIEISAIMELFIKMVTVVESQELHIEISRWLNNENLIEKLIQLLHPSEKEEKHYNASQLLSELLRVGRDTISQYTDSEEDPLLLTLEKTETIEKMLQIIFEDSSLPNSNSSVVNGISTLSSMLEIKTPVVEGIEELVDSSVIERIANGVHTTLDVLANQLHHFHDMLILPYTGIPMDTTWGILDPPLGKVRLNISALIATAVATNTKVINDALAKTGTINVLLDLFSRYEWNNFLHTYVQQCILAILNAEDEKDDESNNENVILKHLFQECNIVQRCLSLWEANEISEKSGQQRKGYMGHLTRIINELANSKERGPNYEIVKSMFNELSDEVREEWNHLVTGPLEETNKKNFVSPMNSMLHAFDSDSDGDDYGAAINISQYEGTLQQAFENYQVQPMTNEFIESFGYDENNVEENENIKNPFDDVGNIDFSINANEESENEKLFENICIQKIQPFDDSSSDEEDIWEEKHLTFSSSPTQARESKNDVGSDSDSSSDDESTDNKVTKDDDPFPNTTKDDDPFASTSIDDPFVTTTKEEKMEVDTEWTANFDNMGMDTSDWVPADTNVKLSTGKDFADFTNIELLSTDNNVAISPVAMETEGLHKPSVASAYEVKMEEDHPISTAGAVLNDSQLSSNTSEVKENDGSLSPSREMSITVKSVRSSPVNKEQVDTKKSEENKSEPSFVVLENSEVVVSEETPQHHVTSTTESSASLTVHTLNIKDSDKIHASHIRENNTEPAIQVNGPVPDLYIKDDTGNSS